VEKMVNNASKQQMGFNSAFKGLICCQFYQWGFSARSAETHVYFSTSVYG